MSHGYCFPVLISQVISRMPDSQRGYSMATFTGLWELASLASPPIFGMIAETKQKMLSLFRKATQ